MPHLITPIIKALKLPVRYNNLFHRLASWSLSIRPYWINLMSGYQVSIDSLITLSLFIELFSTEIYAKAFDLLDEINLIIDLGANRGLFLIYAYHKIKTLGRTDTPKTICVEPGKENFTRLIRHIEKNRLSQYVIPLEGAVTNVRNGKVCFKYNKRHHLTGIVQLDGLKNSRQVDVIDLSHYVENRWIDILKIDIEGSEENFLSEYSDVLEKTRVLVIEFHLKSVNLDFCRKLIQQSGFVLHSLSGVDHETTIVETYYRPYE